MKLHILKLRTKESSQSKHTRCGLMGQGNHELMQH